MTYVHTFDDMPGLPTNMPIFDPLKYRVDCRDEHGNRIQVETQVTSAALGKIRNLSILEEALEATGELKKRRLGKMDVLVVQTQAVAKAVKKLALQGVSHYRPRG